MSMKSALRINLSASYVMKSITSISHQRGNAGVVHEVYDSLFFPSYLSFPLEGKSREAGKGGAPGMGVI